MLGFFPLSIIMTGSPSSMKVFAAAPFAINKKQAIIFNVYLTNTRRCSLRKNECFYLLELLNTNFLKVYFNEDSGGGNRWRRTVCAIVGLFMVAQATASRSMTYHLLQLLHTSMYREPFLLLVYLQLESLPAKKPMWCATTVERDGLNVNWRLPRNWTCVVYDFYS